MGIRSNWLLSIAGLLLLAGCGFREPQEEQNVKGNAAPLAQALWDDNRITALVTNYQAGALGEYFHGENGNVMWESYDSATLRITSPLRYHGEFLTVYLQSRPEAPDSGIKFGAVIDIAISRETFDGIMKQPKRDAFFDIASITEIPQWTFRLPLRDKAARNPGLQDSPPLL